MATIERLIHGDRWSVECNGTVRLYGTVVLMGNGEMPPCPSIVKSGALRTAFGLRDEWEELDREERLDAPPTVELPEGFQIWRQPDGWCLMSPTGKSYYVGKNDLIAARYIVAAADELASRAQPKKERPVSYSYSDARRGMTTGQNWEHRVSTGGAWYESRLLHGAPQYYNRRRGEWCRDADWEAAVEWRPCASP